MMAHTASGRPTVVRTSVPRGFQFGILFFILATGTFPLLLQTVFNGVSGPGGPFALEFLTQLIYDLLLAAPVIVLAGNAAGMLHPIILAVTVWPILTRLPALIDQFFGYSGLLAGQPVRPPYFQALSWQSGAESWLNVASYNGLMILSLLSVYAGFAFASRQKARRVQLFAEIDTNRLRKIFMSIIVINFLAIATFIQLRGGLTTHIASLSFGRFRAFEGLGPLIALFNVGYISLLLWICFRPQDARLPLFMAFFVAVATQQFLVVGSRGMTLMVLVAVGLAWSIVTQRVPWRLALAILPVAFLLLGFLNVVRNAGLDDATALEAVQSTGFSGVVQRSQEEFEVRQTISGSVPVIADAMRTTGPMLGYTYIGAIFAMVPRAIWEEKPRGPGSLYAQYFLGEAREGTAVPIGPVAEAFWNFHIPGVIALFAIYGFLLQRMSGLARANPRNGLVSALLVLFITQFGVSTDQLVIFQQSLLNIAVVLGVVLVFYPSAFGLRAHAAIPRPGGRRDA